ncbi:MAG: hypothetical protein SFY32_04795 [Bacteroidota bacterium]|nr:hypothetical protein [Bacteroidota bacterium]
MQQIQINIIFVLKAIHKRLALFIGLNIAVVIITTVISYTLPKYYESKVVFYPYSPEATDPRTFLYKEKVDIYVFSYLDQSDRYILTCHTKKVLDTLVRKYDLYKRYKVNMNEPKEIMNFYADLVGNIVVKKGENGAVLLSVFDQNPDTAAMMANEILKLVEEADIEKMRERNQKVFEIYQQHYIKMNGYVNSLKDSLDKIRAARKNAFKEEVAIINQMDYTMEEFTKVKFQYEQAKSLVNQTLRTIYLIEPAQPNLKKARPKRLYMIAGALLASLFFTTIGFAAFHFYEKAVKN